MVVLLVTDWQEGVWWPRGSMSAKAPSRSRRQLPPGPASGGPGGRWWERPSARSLEVAATATTTTTTATTTTTTAIASATFFLFLRILSSRSWSACPGVFDHHSFSWVEGYMINEYIISILSVYIYVWHVLCFTSLTAKVAIARPKGNLSCFNHPPSVFRLFLLCAPSIQQKNIFPYTNISLLFSLAHTTYFLSSNTFPSL